MKNRRNSKYNRRNSRKTPGNGNLFRMCDSGLCDENKNIKCYKMLYVIFLIDKGCKNLHSQLQKLPK